MRLEKDAADYIYPYNSVEIIDKKLWLKYKSV